MGLLEETLKGKSLADYTNTQLRLALGAVLYTNTADMWDRYLKQLGFTGSVADMLQKYYVSYNVPQQFRNYINAGASIFNPQNLFAANEPGYLYDLDDQFAEKHAYRRNLLTYSEQFDNAMWAKNNGGVALAPVVTSNVEVAPDGTTTADQVVFTLNGGSTLSDFSQLQQTPVSSGLYTFSFYAKTSDGTSKVLSVVGAGGTLSFITITGDWQRFTISDPLSGNAALRIRLRGGEGTASSATIHIWGAQLEVGSTATEYQRVTDWNTELLAAFPQTSVFLDSAGTTPATVNGLVGLVLDKSKGLALGAEIKSSGAIGLVGAATAATYNTTTGEGTATRVDASNQSYVQWSGLSTGSWYLLTIQNTGANALSVRSGGQSGTAWLTLLPAETKTLYVPEGSGLVTITSSGGAVSFTISTIKQAQGNHAYQGTTGSKPILRGTPTGANLASGASWTAGTGWSIAGDTATATTSSGTLSAASVAAVVGKFYRVTYTITRTAGSIQPTLGGRTGASRSASGTYVQYFDNATSTAALVFTGTGFSGTVTLNTIEAVDISAGSVSAPYALQFDGVDDFLQTAAVNFTATDKVTVCHGVRKLSDAALSVLVELSGNLFLNNGVFLLYAPSAASPNYGFFSKGTVAAGVAQTGYASPVTNVITGIGSISSDGCALRVNGVQVASVPDDQGTGNYGNYPIYFGRRGGSAAPYNGLMYSSVCIGRLPKNDAELANIERWAARKAGLTL